MEKEEILKNIKAAEATLRQLKTQLDIKTNEEKTEKLKRQEDENRRRVQNDASSRTNI